MLGCYSQGAMVASEVAFQTDMEIAGLVLLWGRWWMRGPGSVSFTLAAARRYFCHTAAAIQSCLSKSPTDSARSLKQPASAFLGAV